MRSTARESGQPLWGPGVPTNQPGQATGYPWDELERFHAT